MFFQQHMVAFKDHNDEHCEKQIQEPGHDPSIRTFSFNSIAALCVGLPLLKLYGNVYFAIQDEILNGYDQVVYFALRRGQWQNDQVYA